MQVTIARLYENKTEDVTYNVALENVTLLQLLNHIKTTQDATLSFSQGCHSSICGSCAIRVNNTEVLACAYKVQDGDYITPLNNMPIIRDLIVDNEAALLRNQKAHAYMQEIQNALELTPEDEKASALQSDCILCGSCYSSCPVYELKPDFLGPFALTRVWRYVSDRRDEAMVDEQIKTIQDNGVWDCTLCNLCVEVCPQDIAPKQDIVMLRNKSGILGYMDPNFANTFGGGSFDGSPTF